MKDIDEIIAFYQEEATNLQRLITLAVEEREFKMACYYEKPFRKVHRRLRLLKNLENPLYDKLEELERLKQLYERPLPAGIEASYQDYIENNRKRIINQIALLKQQQSEFHVDGQQFDDLIFSMADGSINKFRFYINTEFKLKIIYKIIDNSIVIAINRVKKLRKKDTLSKSDIKALKNIGLQKVDGSLLFFYPLDHFKNAIEIKTITSRIIYEGIGLNKLSNSSYFEIVD